MTKPRVQLDAFVIGAFMILTGICVLRFPGLFIEGQGVRDLCDVIGFFFILVGTLLRMSGRGFKKNASNQGGALVTGGPYKFVRNPMYLGTFLVAIGFMFPLFPLWTIPVFAMVFYSRFIIQIRAEEVWLKQNFGKHYEEYCQRVPSFIPTAASFQNVSLGDVFSPEYLWTTKEKYGLFFWPAFNMIVELIQEQLLWGQLSYTPVIINGMIALIVLLLILNSKKFYGHTR